MMPTALPVLVDLPTAALDDVCTEATTAAELDRVVSNSMWPDPAVGSEL